MKKKEYITPRIYTVMMETTELMAATNPRSMSICSDSSESTATDEGKRNTFDLWEE